MISDWINANLLWRTCKIWDINTGKCIETLMGHVDEVLDIAFNSTGTRLVTASADGTARVYNVHNGACMSLLTGTLTFLLTTVIPFSNYICTGHDGEISKVSFNP